MPEFWSGPVKHELRQPIKTVFFNGTCIPMDADIYWDTCDTLACEFPGEGFAVFSQHLRKEINLQRLH